MIYLDYCATTPISLDVLDSFNKASKEFIGNPNSLHSLGIKSKELIGSATKQISELLGTSENEIIYTSGATESNNLALIGSCLAHRKKGNHLIISRLEHPSIYAICNYLKELGFEVSFVENDQDGLIDFNDLKSKMRPETILVSICAVNSELGIREPLKMIRQIIKKENPETIFHSDMTQALGKIPVNVKDVDMASFSIHKIYGPKGIGLLYKSNFIKIEPLIHGSNKEKNLRPGTPAVPLIAASSKAIRLGIQDLDRKETFIRKLNEKIREEIQDLEGILINSTKYSIPHILNISLNNIKPETFIHAMEEYEIYIGTNTACASGEVSPTIMALFNDEERARHSIRISLSYLTTTEEINRFLNCFRNVYNKLDTL